MTRLLLFDIDLTLIYSGGAGRLAIDRAIERVLGVPEGTAGIRFDGRTDRGIFLEAVTRFDPAHEHRTDEVMEAYLQELPGALASKEGAVLPGVENLLDALKGEAAAVGLATGNMERGARAKLGHFGLWERFRGGGFGDHAVVRSEIIEAAIADIARHHGAEADPSNAVVIGDTPLDIEAAHAAGARALGVGTGRFVTEELLAAGAEMAVDDLLETDRVLELLLG
jgi:phosphoglycolate phosphatase